MNEMNKEEKDNLILTAVGPDKVGLVEKISEFVLKRGCNIEDSKMAVFCGEFALILLISGDSEQLRKVASASNDLETETALNIWVKTASKREREPSSPPHKLTVSCMDHPGVVYKLSGILSHLGINIESMETKTSAAPVSGAPIFRLEALLSIPAEVPVNVLRARLEDFAREENIDFELALAY